MSASARFLLLATATAAFASLVTAGDDKPAAEIELKPIKYDALKAAVRAQRGKVVVVDIWADFCIPCKQAFPHLVQLHKNYAKDGLVCMSVSVDLPERREPALKFLRKQNATFNNYWIDEPEGLWQDKWDMSGPPVVFVFDRQGKRAAKFEVSVPFDHHDIEKVVKRLLAER